MHLGYHGGKCCGVKHIRGLGHGPGGPNENTAPLEDATDSEPCDGAGNDIGQGRRFFRGKAPKETRLERLDRYLEFLKTERKGGLVEVCLSEYECYLQHSPNYQKKYTQAVWIPLLLERGFKLVSKFYNSNSRNYVQVYHLIIDIDGKNASITEGQA